VLSAVPTECVFPVVALLPVLRLWEAGQTGDVLRSTPGGELVRDELPATAPVLDLWAVRLPGLTRRLRVWRLLDENLPEDAGPLRTVDALLHAVPETTTSFLGRAATVAEVVDGLDAHRLISVVGPGGIGKTRLAVAAAVESASSGRSPDGVHFVDLAPLDGNDRVLPAIAKSLGIVEREGRTVGTSVIEHVRDSAVLLVLDNCEHVRDEAGQVVELLRPAVALRILVTSRTPLRVEGEHVVHLAPLPSAEAVTLFSDRAIAASPPFDPREWRKDISEICAHLEGVPLAIELVAARADLATPADLLRRLQTHGALDVGAPRSRLRHSSMRAVTAWSFGLLERLEAALARRLGIFRGSFDQLAVDAVCGFAPLDDIDRFALLTALIDHSLVRVADEPGGRATGCSNPCETWPWPR
jgi:predicted ATPase